MATPPSNPENQTLDPKAAAFAKYVPRFIIGALVLAALAIGYQVVVPPHTGKADVAQKKEETPTVNTDDLNIQKLLKNDERNTKNIERLWKNQTTIKEALEKLIASDATNAKNQANFRRLLAIYYKELLEDEQKISELGGGFNVHRKVEEDPINPLIQGDNGNQAPPINLEEKAQ